MEFVIQPYVEFMIEHKIPYAVAFSAWYVLEFLLISVFLLIAVLIFVLAERKILALFTVRKGPNRVGLGGCLQTVADAIKLLFKEDVVPEKADRFLFGLAPVVVFAPIMFVWTLLPFSMSILPVKSDVGVLFFMAVMLIPVMGILIAGFASNNKYSLLAAFRSVVQLVSYEIPMMFATLAVVVLAGSMSFIDIVTEQYHLGLLSWFIFPSFLGFLVFFIASLAAMNRTPFDLHEAESELVAGHTTEYSGMKFAMFYLAEYAGAFIICTFTVIMFLGGYMPPLPFSLADFFAKSELLYGVVLTCEQIFWLVLKTCLLLFVVIWIRATLPRMKADKLAEFGWKYLLPISVVNLLIVCVIKLGGLYVF